MIYSFFLSLGIYCVPAEINSVSVAAQKKGEVRNKPDSLKEAERLGGNILNLLRRLKKG